MSCSVEVVVTPMILKSLLLATGTAAAAVAAGAAVYGAYVLIDQLHHDYEEQLAAFHARAETDALHRNESVAAQTALRAAAMHLAEQTRLATRLQDGAVFLRESVQQLLDGLPTPPSPKLQQQALALQDALAASPGELSANFLAYQQLAEVCRATQAPLGSDSRHAFNQEMTALRAAIQAPLLDGKEHAKLRAQLLAQCEALQAAFTRQPAFARQGLSQLHQRVNRELREQATHCQQQARQAEERRALVSDIFAKLQAISRQQRLPILAEQSDALLKQLSDILVNTPEDEMARLHGLAEQASTLYASCEQALHGQLASAIISEQVTAVLLGMGYQVTQLPAQQAGNAPALLTACDEQIGIRIHIDDNGRLSTEMVALNEQSAKATAIAEDQVCQVVDQMLEELRARQVQVRERYRRSLPLDGRLQVIEAAVTEQPVVATAAPLVMQMEEPTSP